MITLAGLCIGLIVYVMYVGDAARYFKVHPITIRRWIWAGKLHAVKVFDTGRWIITDEDVQDFISNSSKQ